MATVVKDFKIKSGLVVEGANATVNGFDILTKKTADQNYIIGLIGGAATPNNTPDTVVLRDENGDFSAGTITADLVGDVTGTVSSISNHSTDDLSEGLSNKYFTDQRALDATASAYDVAGSASTAEANAIAAAALDATSKANAAEAAANLYTDGRETVITTAYQLYADQAEADAVSTAATDATTKANAAEAAAKLYADGLASNYDAAGSAAAAEIAAKAYTDQEVAALVDGAPALLDTLNELAAAIADNPNYATDVANLVATKADTSYVDQEIADAISATTYTAGANIDITANVVSVTGLDSGDISDFNTAAVSANTGLWDNLGSAATAETNAKSYADGLAVNYDPAGSAATAESNANTFTTSSINALDTDDIEEGVTNLYFTNTRAQAAVAQDIQDAVDGVNGTINALTTDDIAEGTNLYFTDSRAVTALEAVVPNFQAVELDSVAKQVAATLSAPTAGIQSAYSWTAVDYRSAEFLVKVAYGTHTEISKVLLTLDTSDNIAITEYGIVGTNGSASSISASVSAGSVSLDVTTTNNNSTVTVVGTLLA